MIEHIKTHWKTIVIFLLIAVIVFILYRREKEQQQVEVQQATGNKQEVTEKQENVGLQRNYYCTTILRTITSVLVSILTV